MPAVGDQHKSIGPAAANPFEETKPQPTPYTASEIATLQSRLDKQLGPEYISSRAGPSGQKVHYVAGEKVINLANEVFGFNGWSSAIQNIQIDFVDEHAQTGKISLGLSVVVRVTLRDGSYHEDIGYGHIENCKGKAAAFAKAKKEGTTDALKRALRTFGKVLGNCIYDKEFMGKVVKMRVGKGKWDENELHRHPDFAPVKKEETNGHVDMNPNNLETIASRTEPELDMDESFDIADFEDAEFGDEEFGDPDQIILPEPALRNQGRSILPQEMGPPSRNGITTSSRPPNARIANAPPAPATRSAPTPQQANQTSQQRPIAPPGAHLSTRTQANQSAAVDQYDPDENHHSSLGVPSHNFVPQNPLPGQYAAVRPAAFYNARAADLLDQENKLTTEAVVAPNFNPHAETPSIRKTAGVDHNRSGPLRRDTLAKEHGIVTSPGSNAARRDFIDPRADTGRRLGIPGQAGTMSPLARNGPGGGPGMQTSAYRPPTRRGNDGNVNAPATANGGGMDRVLTATKRPMLGDVSNVHQQHSVTATTGDGVDAKRMKMSGTGMGMRLDGQVETTGKENEQQDQKQAVEDAG